MAKTKQRKATTIPWRTAMTTMAIRKSDMSEYIRRIERDEFTPTVLHINKVTLNLNPFFGYCLMKCHRKVMVASEMGVFSRAVNVAHSTKATNKGIV
mmetsp:Transcript_11063/g.20056  ORF Transcript_11063/g.20056 Transcript_11063/m.20056 type:complete len:97 (-) Transcript_11063:727-1017(-)